MNTKKWLILAVTLTIAFPACALGAPFVMKALCWRLGPDPAVAVLKASPAYQRVAGLVEGG